LYQDVNILFYAAVKLLGMGGLWDGLTFGACL